jgi:type IX secretion system PorP/SprF family membrane protein
LKSTLSTGLLWLYLLLPGSAWAQDIHFSKWFFAPQLLSPAEIGHFPAMYRVHANQKTQWRQVSKPYTTFALAVDGGLPSLPGPLSVGVALMNDVAGDGRFNTFSMLTGGAWAWRPFGDDRHTLRPGIQMGLTQIRVDPDAFSFDKQFNGIVYDPSLPTGERLARNTRWYANVNLGAAYTYRIHARKEATAGWSVHNLNRPSQSFYNDTGVQLAVRHGWYTYGTWQLTEAWDALPAVRIMRQGTFTETIAGSAARYTLIDERGMYRAIFAGYFGRLGDSGIAMVGAEVNEWRAAISYDINVSQLKPASRNRGGFEFSVQYLWQRTDRTRGFQHKYCPSFL